MVDINATQMELNGRTLKATPGGLIALIEAAATAIHQKGAVPIEVFDRNGDPWELVIRPVYNDGEFEHPGDSWLTPSERSLLSFALEFLIDNLDDQEIDREIAELYPHLPRDAEIWEIILKALLQRVRNNRSLAP
jgi:hypothetical protein